MQTRGPRDDGRSTALEHAASFAETLFAVVLCTLMATVPVWVPALLFVLGFSVPASVTFPLAVLVFLPAFVRVPGAPQLTPGQRWGRNLGRVLRAPLDLVARRRLRRAARSLGGGSSSTAAPALVDHNRDG